ncbi:DNA polymerase III subunit Tau [Anaeromyxobacter dehalogenans 2CP-C]|uniref:DNA polymerase III subunit Tau n=1 Tax=Anaeromyxobacter dehalogenans (strain 2CP-C) TaxID=290397 RepID=Q2IPS9_ANADE|nr:DNA polymerase III subunit Tau [Anaeromyxobacter dehalogenans 2CP-C]
MSDTPSPDYGITATTSAANLSEADLRAAFPSSYRDGPPPAAAAQPARERAVLPSVAAPLPESEDSLRAAFPSSYKDVPPPAAPAAEAARLDPATSAPVPAPAGSESPPAEPHTLTTSGLEITVPAGLELDPASAEAFDAAAVDLGLDAKGAQRLADIHHEAITGLMAEADAAWVSHYGRVARSGGERPGDRRSHVQGERGRSPRRDRALRLPGAAPRAERDGARESPGVGVASWCGWGGRWAGAAGNGARLTDGSRTLRLPEERRSGCAGPVKPGGVDHPA